ncbi:glycosyltransferase family 9 protein [candidate division KSB1 bacterium]|nr:glycosyltransferase family 9 protein [candidate division KSB1 bacterium]
MNKSCLVIKNDGIGDLIISAGIISELAKKYSGGLDLVTCIQNKEIAEQIVGVRNIYYVSRDSLIFFPLVHWFGIHIPIINERDYKVLKKISSVKYDLGITLRRFIRQSTLIIMNFVRATEKYCVWQYPTTATYSSANKFSSGWKKFSGNIKETSELSYYNTFISTILGLKINPTPRLGFTNRKIKQVDSKLIGINIAGENDDWPLSHWLDLISALIQQNYKILLFGGENCIPHGNLIEDKYPIHGNYIGKLSFKDSIEVLEKVNILIGDDTGYSHFASLFVNKCLIILGGGTFGRFFPWPNTSNQYIIYNAMDCYDCNWKCKFRSKKCLQSVQPGSLLEYVNDIINGNNEKNSRNLSSDCVNYNIAWRLAKEKGQLNIDSSFFLANKLPNELNKKDYLDLTIESPIDEKNLKIFQLFYKSSLLRKPLNIFTAGIFNLIYFTRKYFEYFYHKVLRRPVRAIFGIVFPNMPG